MLPLCFWSHQPAILFEIEERGRKREGKEEQREEKREGNRREDYLP